MKKDILLFSKQGAFSRKAVEKAQDVFGDRLVNFTGRVGDPLPAIDEDSEIEIILSFLSPWILPAALLRRADLALNWHPGSADYPGTGCYNFALYERAGEYGAVCHIMEAKVDTGIIVEERRFPVDENESVETLKYRTMETMLAMFDQIVGGLAVGHFPEPCGAGWSRRPFTRRELDDLTIITADMSDAEIKRRIRATTYPGYPGPRIMLGGEYFYYPVPDRKPLA